MAEKRKRGAPKGNHNALKHGFYSAGFKKADLLEFDFASGMEGISEEIALIRLEIKKAVSGGDTGNLTGLVKAATALEKLIRTHQKFFGSENNLVKAFENAIKNSILPMLKGDVEGFLKWHYETKAPPGAVLVTGNEVYTGETALSLMQEETKKQLAWQNEADLP